MKRCFLLIIVIQANILFAKEIPSFNDCQLIRGDFLWMLDHELSNIEYREFINSDIQNKKYLPDTSCWQKEIGFYESYEKYYYRHPKYNNYPVVGISKESALAYCSWLTTKINDRLINNADHQVKTRACVPNNGFRVPPDRAAPDRHC